MNSEDTFCSSSSSDDQPFHSTPVKTKVQFVSNKTSTENGACSDSETSDNTLESQEGHTTVGTLTSSVSSTALDTADSIAGDLEIHRPTDMSSTAWELWVLKKEREYRKELHLQMILKQKQRENEKMLVEVKLRQTRAAEENFRKWLKRKNLERKQQVEEEKYLIAKKEQDAKAAKEKAKHMAEIQLRKWKERKLWEKKTKLQNYGQESVLSPKEVEERRRKSDLAFKQWLTEHRYCYREHYSYAYAGGIVVSYYDLTSSSRPNFFNPEPWIS